MSTRFDHRKCSLLIIRLTRAAELLTSLPQPDPADGSDTEPDSPIEHHATPGFKKPRGDPTETVLETRESHKFLLAKSFFDCREFDRCASVFLPTTLPKIPSTAISTPAGAKGQAKGKSRLSDSVKEDPKATLLQLGNVSQKALFLSLYAKYMAGEKRRDEESEMILGPIDGGITANRELNTIAGILESYLAERETRGKDGGGWLEYLYGIVLAKGKNEDLAKEFLIRSVNIYPFNWGAWQELSNLLNNIEEVSAIILVTSCSECAQLTFR